MIEVPAAGDEPRTTEEYIQKVRREAQRMEKQHVPSHKQLIDQYDQERQYYETRFKQTVGVIVILVLAFLVVKLTSATGPDV